MQSKWYITYDLKMNKITEKHYFKQKHVHINKFARSMNSMRGLTFRLIDKSFNFLNKLDIGE